MAKPEAFLALEESLTDKLNRHWAIMFRKVRKDLIEKLKAENWAEAVAIVNNISMVEIADKEKKYIKTIGMSALLYGAGNLRPIKETSVYKQKNGLKILDPAVVGFKGMMEHVSETTKKQLVKLISLYKQDVERRNVQKALVQSLANPKNLTSTMMKSGTSNINISASLYNSRLASYGFLVEATYLNITTYRISEVLDNRTCPICNSMDGRTFEVSTTFQRLDRNLRVEDPEILKTIAKFPSQTKANIERIKGMTSDEISAEGFAAPPFHPLCRGILESSSQVVEDSSTSTTEPTVTNPTIIDRVTDTITDAVVAATLVS